MTMGGVRKFKRIAAVLVNFIGKLFGVRACRNEDTFQLFGWPDSRKYAEAPGDDERRRNEKVEYEIGFRRDAENRHEKEKERREENIHHLRRNNRDRELSTEKSSVFTVKAGDEKYQDPRDKEERERYEMLPHQGPCRDGKIADEERQPQRGCKNADIAKKQYQMLSFSDKRHTALPQSRMKRGPVQPLSYSLID